MMLRSILLFSALASVGSARADSTINFFGDANYFVGHDGSTENWFQASSLDIFAMQTEGKFSFVGELAVEAFGTNQFSIDADRLEIMYQPTPWLRVRAGRIRTGFGYYSDAYQNGKFFFLPLDRPAMYETNGVDGILPSHGVGAQASLAYELGNQLGRLTLDVEALNGRGNSDEVQAFRDNNNPKAADVRVRYVGEDGLEGLVVGANLYVDQIAANGYPAMHELILGSHAAYVANRIHAVYEGLWIRHRENGSQTVHTVQSLVGEAGYTLTDWTPYLRYEYQHASDVDPYFSASQIDLTTLSRFSAGVKYAASASVALKLQGAVEIRTDSTGYLAGIQAAFAF